jgi:hypothetical protein
LAATGAGAGAAATGGVAGAVARARGSGASTVALLMCDTIACPTANTTIAVMNEIRMPLDRLVLDAGADADTVSLIMLISRPRLEQWLQSYLRRRHERTRTVG